MTRFAWKRLSDGQIHQGATAATADDLFEAAGFGAVDVDKPIKGFLAVPVIEKDGAFVEAVPDVNPAP